MPPSGSAGVTTEPAEAGGPIRITQGVERGRAVSILVDGAPTPAFIGESVAAALLSSGHLALRRSPRGREWRGPFCFMGSCQECLVWIDGEPMPSCRVPVADGMIVELDLAGE